MKQAVLVVALASVPDIAGLRRLHAFPDALSDYEVGEYALQRQRANRAGDELPPMLRQIVCVSTVRLSADGVQVRTFVSPAQDEAALLRDLFIIHEAAPGGLVGWGRDDLLPVLNARALTLGLAAPAYWRDRLAGDRFLDLVPVTGAGPGCSFLDQFDRLGGGPGCDPVDSTATRDAWLAGDSTGIARRCEASARAAARIHLRLQHAAGHLEQGACEVLTAQLMGGS